MMALKNMKRVALIVTPEGRSSIASFIADSSLAVKHEVVLISEAERDEEYRTLFTLATLPADRVKLREAFSSEDIGSVVLVLSGLTLNESLLRFLEDAEALSIKLHCYVTNPEELLHAEMLRSRYSMEVVLNSFCQTLAIEALTDAVVLSKRMTSSDRKIEKPRLQERSLKEQIVVQKKSTSKEGLKILFQNRDNTFETPGGDTVTMERLKDGLEKMGVVVEYDLQGEKDPAAYDLVHLFNFAIPEVTEKFARKAHERGVPFVVSAIYEDWPKFFNQMYAFQTVIEAYSKAGQPHDRWMQYETAGSLAKPALISDNSWTAKHAAAILATGETEARTILRDYPDSAPIEVTLLGHENRGAYDDGELFYKDTGLKDFILCVGRLEARKNQLMLLKALEDSEETIVFLTSGFTYEPGYAQSCMDFKRKGKTLFLGRLSSEMLLSCYSASAIHALPSWYELPGLVSLEAARAKKNVVVTEFGTARDYLGDLAFYCRPDSAESIKGAVEKALREGRLSAERGEKLEQKVLHYTWENYAAKVLDVYQRVLQGTMQQSFEVDYEKVVSQSDGIKVAIESASDKAHQASRTVAVIPAAVAVKSEDDKVQQLCVEGDEHFRAGRNEEASKKYREALGWDSSSLRAKRSLAVIAIREGRFTEAETLYRDVLAYNSEDAKALAGLGLIRCEQNRTEEGHALYVQASRLSPTDAGILLNLINSSYGLGKFEDLEKALIKFLNEQPENVDMQYCLAGCYYKQKKLTRAKGIVERILQVFPTHAPSMELKEKIENSYESPNTLCTNVEVNKDDALSVAGQLAILEEAKSLKDYDKVIAGADVVIHSFAASSEQKALAKVLKGEALACKRMLPEAIKEFSDVESNPVYSHRAFAGRGAVMAASSRWDEAKYFFEKALSLNPKNDVANAGLGMCASYTGDTGGAWKQYEKSLDCNPENVTALFGLVELGYKLNKLSKVQERLEKYLEIHPLDLSMLYSYAGCFYAQGEKEQAKIQLEKITLLDPNHKLANELLVAIRQNKPLEKVC